MKILKKHQKITDLNEQKLNDAETFGNIARTYRLRHMLSANYQQRNKKNDGNNNNTYVYYDKSQFKRNYYNNYNNTDYYYPQRQQWTQNRRN